MLKSFEGTEHKDERLKIGALLKTSSCLTEMPYTTLDQLVKNNNNRAKRNQKTRQLRNSKTWSAPQNPEGISLCSPTVNQEISEEDLEECRRQAFELINKELQKFPPKVNAHNRDQRKKITKHYAQFAFDILPQKDLYTLYNEANQKPKKSREYKELAQPNPKYLGKEIPHSVTEAMIIEYEKKGYSILDYELSNSNDKNTRKDTRKRFDDLVFPEMPYLSITKLFNAYNARSGRKQRIKKASQPSLKTWSVPEYPERVCAYDPKENQKIAEEDLKKNRVEAFKLVRRTLDKFPLKDGAHNKEQQDKIIDYYYQCAFKNMPQKNLRTLHNEEKAIRSKRTRESQKKRKKKANTKSPRTTEGAGSPPVTAIASAQQEISSNQLSEQTTTADHNDIQDWLIENTEPINQSSTPSSPCFDFEPPENFNPQESPSEFAQQIGLENPDPTQKMGSPTPQHFDWPKPSNEAAALANTGQQDNWEMDTDAITQRFDDLQASNTAQLIDDFFANDEKGLLDVELPNDVSTVSIKHNDPRGYDAFLTPVKGESSPKKTQKRSQDDRHQDDSPKSIKKRKPNPAIK